MERGRRSREGRERKGGEVRGQGTEKAEEERSGIEMSCRSRDGEKKPG